MLKFTFCSKQISSPACSIGFRNFHNSSSVFGIGEFIEVKKSTAPMTAGRAWTSPDLRRKSFEDLHKLWFVLYKERNLLLSEREKQRRARRPVTSVDENRYINIKRSMGAIKFVLGERKKIDAIIRKENEETTDLTVTSS